MSDNNLTIESCLKKVNSHIQSIQRAELFFPDESAASEACYWMQQATEKIIKALILLGGQTPAWTHDIEKLRKHAESLDMSLPESIKEIEDSLTKWEASSRYDADFDFDAYKYNKGKKALADLIEYVNTNLRALGYRHLLINSFYDKDSFNQLKELSEPLQKAIKSIDLGSEIDTPDVSVERTKPEQEQDPEQDPEQE